MLDQSGLLEVISFIPDKRRDRDEYTPNSCDQHGQRYATHWVVSTAACGSMAAALQTSRHAHDEPARQSMQ
ncbi:MAG TPA: hypothetical protein DEF43_13115 [Chloroflexus aurantiacus]|nr:hypothetical protein [Chloroflexus aurantiacus]